MPLKIFSFGARFVPKKPAPPPFQRKIENATARDEVARLKRTSKCVSQRSPSLGCLSLMGFLGLSVLLSIIACPGPGSGKISGKHYAGFINRTQRAFYLEDRRFAQTLEELNISAEKQSIKAFQFRVRTEGDMAFSYVEVKPLSSQPSRAERREQNRFFAAVGAVAPLSAEASVATNESAHPSVVPTSYATNSEAESKNMMTQAILCQADKPGVGTLPEPKLIDGQLACAPGTTMYD